MGSTEDILITTGLRGYHTYRDTWTNIAVNQEITLIKQPNNRYDRNAIAGFVKGLHKSDPSYLTEIGHLPRELAAILSAVTEPDWYCCVTRLTPTFTKGLEIPITISLTHDKRNKSLAKKLRVKGFVV